MSSFAARPLKAAPAALAIPKPGSHAVGALTLESPATALMTDLRQMPAVHISGGRTLADAEAHMVAAGVRLLFVTDATNALVGMITAYDLAGEKPLMVRLSRESHPDLHEPNQVLVSDIMTPVSQWRGVDFPTVSRARLGDIMQTFLELGQPHLLVFEATPGEAPVVRGLFSATQFERVLRVHMDLVPRPGSFAEIEQMLSRP
jgi:hypothetical protein